jgi:hypothetical protein
MEIAQELMPNNQPSRDPAGSSTTPPSAGPPTPLNIGGDLPTIPEETEELDADELIIESFYAELMSDQPIADVTDEVSRYEEMRGNVPPQPVHTMPENSVLFWTEEESLEIQIPSALENEIYLTNEGYGEPIADTDEIGEYAELCFTTDMAPVVLNEDQHQWFQSDDVATMRVYLSANTKRAVVVKEDDLLNKKELLAHATEVASSTSTELKKWITNKCFKKCLLKHAQNVMTSRYVAKWKWIRDTSDKWQRVIRMRLCLRGFMDLEAFSLDTFSGTAKRTSQRILASEAACHPDWIIASLDIDLAFLKGFTYKELAEEKSKKERMVCFVLPPGSATLLRQFPGFEDFDETIHCLQCIKPGTGTKDAPRAFSLKLRKTTKQVGRRSTSFDPEFEIKKDLLTAKHVDDVNMTGTEPQIDHYVDEVEKVFGKCKLNKRQFTNCGVRYTLQDNHDVVSDQDEYIKTLRPIVSPELTGAAAEKEATKTVADPFVSLRGAAAYTTLAQAWIQVYIVALQRVQVPTNLDVRRLNAIT